MEILGFLLIASAVIMLCSVFISAHRESLIERFLQSDNELYQLYMSLSEDSKQQIDKGLKKILGEEGVLAGFIEPLKKYITVVTSTDQIDIQTDWIYQICPSDILIYKRISTVGLKFEGVISIKDIIDLKFTKDPPSTSIQRNVIPIMLSNGVIGGQIHNTTSYNFNDTGSVTILLKNNKIVNIHCAESFYASICLYVEVYRRKEQHEETSLERN